MGGNAFWGSLVKVLRDEQGISQRKLAEMASVNRATLRRMENGETDGHVADLEKILTCLGYELDAYKTGTERPQVSSMVKKNRLLLIGLND